MSGSRFFVVWCLRGESLGFELTVIMWIAMPCVAHVAKLNYEAFKYVHVHPYPFYVIKLDYLHKGLEKEGFHILK